MSDKVADSTFNMLAMAFMLFLLGWCFEAWVLSSLVWPVLHEVFPSLATIASKSMSFGQALGITLLLGLLRRSGK